jgi:CrcB protein
MRALLLVAFAGAVGTAVRFGLGRYFGAWHPTTFPWATFVVNVLGCFLLGVIAEAAGDRRVLDVELRSVLGIGLMGGFTTYSSFDIEMLRLAQSEETGLAAGYGLATIGVCLIAGSFGLALGRALR